MIYYLLVLIFLKLLFFWLWLWQLKEYHLGRFLAHFQEGRAIKKILSSFWRLKYPQFTLKIIIISFFSIFLAILMFSKGFSFSTFLLIIIVPLAFQIPTAISKNIFLKKAKRKREQFKDLLVIGITGSYGKTSTKEFLATILSEKFNVLKTKEHQNSEVAISRCILNELNSEHEIFVVEMGAYNRGGIKLLCDIAKPKIGILTGINEQHMVTFGSQENIIKAKYELIESLPEDGVVFFNGKNKYCVELYNKTKIRKYLYGGAAKFFGEENLLGAIKVAKELGMTDDEINQAVDKIENKLPGILLKEGINGIKILDATYSANPDGVMAHLEYLKSFAGQKVIVMPCLIELGKASKEIHQGIGKKIAQVCDLAIITTRDRFKELKEGALETGMKSENILFLENPKEILEKIKQFCKSGDVILLESRIPQVLINQLTYSSPEGEENKLSSSPSLSFGTSNNSMKPIFTSLSPNTEKDDIVLAWKLLFQPKKWKKGKASQELEEKFKNYLGVKYAFAFNSGRSALMAILDALEIKRGEEILLQAFTCNSAVNPILARKAKPVFVDVDDTLNLDPEDLRKKITPRSKATMIQHNFGCPARIEEILEIARENNLYFIEDCAHSLGARYSPPHQNFDVGVKKFCGTFGKAAFFSFGRDKIISSVFGGMAVTNDDKVAEKIKDFQEKLNYPSNFWIFQQLLHPPLTNYLVMPLYGQNPILGRLILGAFHKLSILSKAVYKKEKNGQFCKYFPKKFPNALALLALNQFKKLGRFNEHRREIADFYQKELKNTKLTLILDKTTENIEPTFLRYPILTNLNTDKILSQARKEKLFLNDGWRKTPIMPPDTNVDKMEYKRGSCPKAEKVAKTIINLPTHINISKKQAQRIVDFLKKHGSKRN